MKPTTCMYACQTIFLFAILNMGFLHAQNTFTIQTIGHGSLMISYDSKVIHIDPYSSQGDYSQLPDADIILVTHGHGDHYDLTAINHIKKETTIMVYTQAVADLGTYVDTAHILANYDSISVMNIPIKAVPAYNVVNTTYHPIGVGNGYILTIGEKRIYIAGDTENIPEMAELGTIDIAFLPMNLPYTMSVDMAEDAAETIMPNILYIYHFGSSDTALIRSRLNDHPEIEVRIGKSTHTESSIRGGQVSKINQESLHNQVQLYPNPVNNSLFIENGNEFHHLSIFDMHGRIVLHKPHLTKGINNLDVSFLKPGTYILCLINYDASQNVFFLKEQSQ